MQGQAQKLCSPLHTQRKGAQALDGKKEGSSIKEQRNSLVLDEVKLDLYFIDQLVIQLLVKRLDLYFIDQLAIWSLTKSSNLFVPYKHVIPVLLTSWDVGLFGPVQKIKKTRYVGQSF